MQIFNMTKESFFLVFVAIGVFSVSLGYGFLPNLTMPFLYDIDVTNTNLSNIFRAISGLYIAFVTFWILGAYNSNLQLPALWSLTIFMTGIALGRIASILIDGLPSPIFIFYLFLEIIFGSIGYIFIKKQ
ncbi:DUF4345 domain-containing protein [Gammaproteobacteria bacterium]|nr:DUF4345 domain-containing protein [Gammaproteobacteria bacterium]|tara:strand:+ start:51 stop:440 length:390 start_codon:yes stop_codon:yes gene_type:complete